MAAVGLAHKMNAFPRELSGGEQQRVAIARAIVGDTTAILADEPTGALDSENGRAVMTILAQIAADPSRAVLVVTHDSRILSFASRIIHMEDGRITGEEIVGPMRPIFAPNNLALDLPHLRWGRQSHCIFALIVQRDARATCIRKSLPRRSLQ